MGSIARWVWCFLGLATSASAAQAITVTPVFTQPYGSVIPLIALHQDRLIIASGSDLQTRIFPAQNLTSPVTIPTAAGVFNLVAHPSGWIAECADNGERLEVFHISNPNQRWTRNFDRQTLFGCAAISIEIAPNGRPRVWIGSTGDQSVAQLDGLTGSTIKVFSGISGAFHFAFHNGVIFGLNEQIWSNHGLPYIYRADNAATLVGDRMGRPVDSKLQADYGPKIFLDDPTDSAFYLEAFAQLLKRFSASDPSTKTLTEYPLSITMPRAISRYGKCLVILGYTPDREARPQWTILDASQFPTLTELRKVQDLGDKSIWSSAHQEIDSTGAVYLAHMQGVSVVRGLLDGLSCR